MNYYTVRTQNEHYYVINEEGMITQYVPGKPFNQYKFSGDWKCFGFHEVLRGRHTGPLLSLSTVLLMLDSGGKATFKNGKGKFIMQDSDHGTARLWGDRVTSVRRHTVPTI